MKDSDKIKLYEKTIWIMAVDIEAETFLEGGQVNAFELAHEYIDRAKKMLGMDDTNDQTK